MVHYKVVETGCKYPDVLIYRDRNEDGDEIVRIFACGVIDKTENMLAAEDVIFENPFSASEYIESFDKIRAENWCKRQSISYWAHE